jgi:hypothetical protein
MRSYLHRLGERTLPILTLLAAAFLLVGCPKGGY